ncbi:CDP-glucose 4,6-dehydratase [Magnetospira sp. QH-2]|uniref:CDP-glucose 4,6-dehydratase n=1 Tax=Magnetospira sp. (strain QH-2) TaxID=1288970 RepID=UPI0003E8153A|nr:CDP-glucose 4,6-dehydratase [Magnetospira sp. QH-2]CCQ75635.1 CDP-glucose 4,6-dehydratase [Magnetospira sp. QH-2]
MTMARGSVDPDFWRGRRVLVTGHTGFKGSWLSLWLTEMGAQVRGFSLAPPSTPNLFTIAQVESLMDHVHGDLRDIKAVTRTVTDFKPEIVLHLAAQALVRPSYDDPVVTYATNVMGTVHLLEAVRSCGSVKALVSVTSDKCYANREWDWGYRESDPMGGHDPYSSSKGCAELVTAAYRDSFFAPGGTVALASARAGNVIGGGDWGLDRLVPDMVRAWSSSETLRIRYPDAIRPWQHVLEPTSGYLQLAQKLATEGASFADGWNFGPGPESEQPVRTLVERGLTLWGDDAQWATENEPQPHEATYLKLDVSKARGKLGWNPRWDLSTTLDKTFGWYRAWHDGADMAALTRRQIKDYMT